MRMRKLARIWMEPLLRVNESAIASSFSMAAASRWWWGWADWWGTGVDIAGMPVGVADVDVAVVGVDVVGAVVVAVVVVAPWTAASVDEGTGLFDGCVEGSLPVDTGLPELLPL